MREHEKMGGWARERAGGKYTESRWRASTMGFRKPADQRAGNVPINGYLHGRNSAFYKHIYIHTFTQT